MPRKKKEETLQVMESNLSNVAKVEKKTENWTVSKLVRQMQKGQAKSNIDIQRGSVWNITQKSLLIHSVIVDYKIPDIICIRRDKNSIDILDGKQRATTLFDFVNNKFKLKNMPEIKFDDESTADYNGMKFSQLPEDIREIIENFNLQMTIFGEETSYEQETEIFYRLNNGTALSASDKNFSKAISKDMITSLMDHPIFDKALTEVARKKLSQRKIVINSYIMLVTDDLSLDSGDVNKFLREYDITEDDYNQLKDIYDRLLFISNDIYDTADPMFIQKRVQKRLLSRNGIPSLVRFMKTHDDDEKLREFFISFFSGEKKATNNDEYNKASSQGSGHMGNILKKQEILEAEYAKI